MTTARATDPMTSRLARRGESVKDEVLNAIFHHGPLITHEILAEVNRFREEHGNLKRQLDISCVSNVPSELIRDEKIHVSGWKINPATGNKCEQYSYGPRIGEGEAMPAVPTGPRRKRGLAYLMFSQDDTIALLRKVMEGPESEQMPRLTELLNQELKARVR